MNTWSQKTKFIIQDLLNVYLCTFCKEMLLTLTNVGYLLLKYDADMQIV